MIRGNVGFVLVALIAICLLVACTKYRYENLERPEQAKHFGTQPGYHELSDFFSVDVDRRLTKFYFLGQSRKNRELIGVISTLWFDLSDYGARQIVYAVSDDGKRLLFFDEPGVAVGRREKDKNGDPVTNLYIFDAESAPRQAVFLHIHRRIWTCIEFPMNYIQFGRVHSIGNTEVFAYSTEGEEASLKARMADCGPL